MVLNHRPLAFELNVGQAAADASFVVHAGTVAALISSTGIEAAVPIPSAARASMRFVGAAKVEGRGGERTGGASYLFGNDPTRWHTHVPAFASVMFGDVWPGIDVVWRGEDGVLEYDFVVHPGVPLTVRANFQYFL